MKEAKRRALRIAFVVEICVFVIFYFCGPRGMQAVLALDTERRELQQVILDLEHEVALLEDDIHAWKTYPLYQEKVAREQLQMAHRNERIYFVS